MRQPRPLLYHETFKDNSFSGGRGQGPNPGPEELQNSILQYLLVQGLMTLTLELTVVLNVAQSFCVCLYLYH